MLSAHVLPMNREAAAGWIRLGMVALALLLLPVAAAAQDPCEVIDVGGTVVLPPDGCEYLSPDEVHEIVDGLPIGTSAEPNATSSCALCSPRPVARLPKIVERYGPT